MTGPGERVVRRFAAVLFLGLVVFIVMSAPASAGTLRYAMDLVGGNGLFVGSQTSDLDVDPARDVAYVGSFVDLGVAVVDITDRARPVVATVLSTDYVGAPDDRRNSSDSADLDLLGDLLAVANQPFGEDGFGGVSLYDVSVPLAPVFLGRIATGGTHDVQIDPGWPGRPYVYAANEASTTTVHIIDASDRANPVLAAEYVSAEGTGCLPSEDDCRQFATAHDLTLLRHPDTGRTLLYVAYWDSGLRIVDVTDAGSPQEIGAYDYTPVRDRLGLWTNCCAHYAQPTPSGDYVLLEDEYGIGRAGGVHIVRTDTCDGAQACVIEKVGFWAPPIPSGQAMAILAEIRAGTTTNGVFQRFFTRDVHNLDVQEDRILAALYSSGVQLVDMTDKASPTTIAFWRGATNMATACHGKNTLEPWGYQGNCYLQGREVWGAKFGDHVPGSPTDMYVYASDFWEGFIVLRTVTR
jgi:hypothetical protein